MAQALTEVAPLGDYLAGAFMLPHTDAVDGVIERVSPRDFADLVMRVPYRHTAVDEAVAHARAAFPGWAESAPAERKRLLVRLRELLALHARALSAAITREVGKPSWEAESEVAAALAKIDVTLSEGLALLAPHEPAPGQHYEFKPHGVAAVLGPFNFPLHLPHGHVLPLLATGNCVVVKPSELTPAVSQLYAQCIHAAGFPAGVFNLVQGGAAQGARLAAHPDVDVVALTGSFAAGQAIKRATIEQPHKLLALELGGRNPAIVLASCDLDKAAHDVLWGAMVSAGQRCSGTAVALVERACFEAFTEKLRRRVAAIVVGDPCEGGVFMGPLISADARARYLASLDRAERDGAEPLTARGDHVLSERGAYVTPSLHLVRAPGATAYEREELFGPDLAIELVEDLAHAVARANDSSYGLSVSVFTRDQACFEQAFRALRYGCVNWNAPTCGASSRLPFGGLRNSGNHRPAALFSVQYAAYPVASIHGEPTLSASAPSPGFPRCQGSQEEPT